MATGPDGRIHLVFAGQTSGDSQQHIYYSVWNGASWAGLVDLPGSNKKEQQPDIAIGPDGHIHVVAMWRPGESGTDTPYTIFYWEYNGVGWLGPTQLSPGTGGDGNSCSSPHVQTDDLGDVHVVWSQNGATGGHGDIMYRKRQSGVWLPTYNITSNNAGTSYGSVACDLAVDRGGSNVHVVWHDDFLNNGFQAYYTRNSNLGATNAWLPKAQWFQLSSGAYGKSPHIWLDESNNPSVVWIDKFGGSENKTAYRRFDGATWQSAQNWGNWSVQEAVFDANNVMHMVFMDTGSGTWELYYSTYDRATNSRSPAQLISAGADTFKVDVAAMARDSGGAVHAIWEERKGAWPGTPGLYYSTNFSLSAPADVESFTVAPSDSINRLYWKNPNSPGFSGTMIRFRTDRFPTGPSDGALLIDKSSAIGASDSFVHSGVTNGVTYYYTAFAHDSGGHYSSGFNASAQPHAAQTSELKRLPDNTPVDMSGKVVSAVFPGSAAIYVQDPDRSSGIRVACPVAASYVPGDIVTVSGTMGTRSVSGAPSERQINSTTPVKTGTGPAPVPLQMGLLDVGGEEIPPYIAGVTGAVGLNNIGLLVRLTGRVLSTISSYLYLDDGSGLVDPGGTPGMLVAAPSAQMGVVAGDLVSVTGIVEGSVVAGQPGNRRFLRIRALADISKLN